MNDISFQPNRLVELASYLLDYLWPIIAMLAYAITLKYSLKQAYKKNQASATVHWAIILCPPLMALVLYRQPKLESGKNVPMPITTFWVMAYILIGWMLFTTFYNL